MRRLLLLLACLAAWPVHAQKSDQQPGVPPAASPGTRRWLVASPPPAGVIRLRNAGRMSIVAVFADPSGSPRGADRLGGVCATVTRSLTSLCRLLGNAAIGSR